MTAENTQPSLGDQFRLILSYQSGKSHENATDIALEQMFGELQKKADHYKTQMHSWMQQSLDNGKAIEAHKAMLEEIGMLLGPNAYLDTDGGCHERVVVSRVPELVRGMHAQFTRAVGALTCLWLDICKQAGRLPVQMRHEQIVAKAISMMSGQAGEIRDLEEKVEDFRDELVNTNKAFKETLAELNETKRGWQTLTATVVRLLGFPGDEIQTRTVDQMVEQRMQELTAANEEAGIAMFALYQPDRDDRTTPLSSMAKKRMQELVALEEEKARAAAHEESAKKAYIDQP